MKTNPLKVALAEGRVQIGTWVNLIRNPAVFTLLQGTGLDYVRVDMEHSAPSIETIANMAILSRALDFPMIVRPPSHAWISRLLDIGVWGLHIPQVDTPEMARAVVDAARYAPLGSRGMSANGPHNDYLPGTPTSEINEQVHLTIMLEPPLAFENIDGILSTPGIDAVTLGPTDLAQDLGVLGRPESKRVIDEHRERMIDAANRHGLDVAMLCADVAEARRWIDAGVKIIAIASDVVMLQDSYRAAVSAIRA